MIVGHQRIWEYLVKSAKRDRLAHAYLFVGPAQVGKMTIALELAKWLSCEENNLDNNPTPTLSFKRRGGEAEIPCGKCKPCLSIEQNQNPDVFILSAHQTDKNDVLKNAEIGIKEIRDLQHKLSLSAYSSLYKIAIIEEAAALSGEAAGALLKTLEEPSSHSLIILISSSWQAVLPTIISRCQLIKFLPVAEADVLDKLKDFTPSCATSKVSVRRATPLCVKGVNTGGNLQKSVKLSAGRPGRAINFLREPERLAEQEKEIEIFEKLLKSPLSWRLEQAVKLSQNMITAQEILNQWLLWLRDRILEISGQAELVISEQKDKNILNKYRVTDLLSACRAIQKTQSILANPSFNAKLAIEVLMMKI
ncbi:MAG: polymerase III, delta prime subunit protein [Parcubacteria group bacterium GW2011_GWA2_43_9b]|nr:MAG: polymerase III, delta prime subunit protein [Parcubacteria group bacterium GW2011_GWA2_43_9b]